MQDLLLQAGAPGLAAEAQDAPEPKSVQDVIAMIMTLPPETPLGEVQNMLASFQTEGPAVEPIEQSRGLMNGLADRKTAPTRMM